VNKGKLSTGTCLSLRADSLTELSHQTEQLYNRQTLDKTLLVKEPDRGWMPDGTKFCPVSYLAQCIASAWDALA